MRKGGRPSVCRERRRLSISEDGRGGDELADDLASCFGGERLGFAFVCGLLAGVFLPLEVESRAGVISIVSQPSSSSPVRSIVSMAGLVFFDMMEKVVGEALRFFLHQSFPLALRKDAGERDADTGLH